MSPVNAIISPAPLQGVQSRGEVTGTPSRAADINALGHNAVLKGEIVDNLGRGSFLLRTDQGDIVIRTDQVLKVGNQVTLRLDTVLGNTQAKILFVDGVLPELANIGGTLSASGVEDVISTGTRAMATTLANAEQPAAITTPTLPALPASEIIDAVLVSAPPPGAAALLPAALQPTGGELAVGSQVTVHLAGAEFAAAAAPSQVDTAPAVSAAALPVASSQAAVAANPAMTIQVQEAVKPATPAGQTSPSVITQVTAAEGEIAAAPAAPATQPPSAQQAPYAAYTKQALNSPAIAEVQEPAAAMTSQQAQTALASGRMEAQVLTSEPQGNMLVQSPLGTLRMPDFMTANGPLSSAKQLLFDLLGISNPTPEPPEEINIPLPAALPQSATGMESALRDTLTFLSAVRPDTAQQIMQNLPQIGPNFTAGSMAFLSALGQGSLTKWLGSDVTALLQQQGQNHLADRLGTEFTALRDSFLSPPQNQWQLFLLPYVHNEELQQARFFLKKEKQKQGQTKKSPDTRFVIEVSLSALGDMQFDGLVRKKEEATQFDLVLRTRSPLPQEDQEEITRIFNEASEITGFAGSINIQAVREFPVKPLDEMVQGETGSILA